MDIAAAKAKISQLTDPRIQEVANLLVEIGLELIACGDDSKIIKDDEEIGKLDLVYKDDDVERYFLFEVSTQQRHITSKINSFFSRWSNSENLALITDKFSIPPGYSISRNFFELSSRTTISQSVEHNLDDQNNRILLDYDLRYFLDAYDKVGKWAKNDLFSFLKIKPARLRTISNIDAIQFYLGDVRAYLYLDRVDNILKYCYIFRRIKDDKGYQRILQKGRIGNIAKKIQSGNLLAFPNTILISSADDFSFCENPTTREQCPKPVKIKVPDYFCACRIVDGQHRLLGFANLSIEHQRSHHLPIIALETVQLDQEMKTFIDINSTQKKIGRNLILTLQADLPWNKSTHPKEYYGKQTVEVIKKLNQSGPLKGKLYIPDALEKRKGKITLNTLFSAIIGNNFVGGRLHLFQNNDEDTETPYRKINEIFLFLNQHLPEYAQDINSYFFTNKGLRMMFRFLQIFERNKIKQNVTCNYETLIKDLKKVFNKKFIRKLDDYYGEGGANKAADIVWAALKRKLKRRYKKLTTNLKKV